MSSHRNLRTLRRPLGMLLSLILTTMLALPPAAAAPALVPATASLTPAPAAPVATQPAALAAPLSITAGQSTFDAATASASGGITITLTVRNNLPPLETPELNPAANVTDTIAALTAFDYSRDPNRIRQVVVSDELLAGVAGFVAADPQPNRNGNRLVWNLGDLDPYGEATIRLRITAPGSAGNFTNLDSGATVYGTHQGRMASAAAAPARLAPDGFAAFLGCTVDANCADPYVLEQAGRLGGDPLAAFAFVRDDVGYESYAGSLRGARGALWSAAGNATDQASLLIALLRASGVPARYLHGTLNTTHAQTLVGSMFPAASGVGGLAPAGEPLADPVNSSALLDPARDHWWVEAYLPGSGWTQLDPSFAAASAGQSFTTAQGPAVAELPDNVRHKVTIALKVEQYNVFSVSPGGVGLSAIQPLSETFATVELVGEPVTLGHLVSTDTSGGLVFTNYEHTYVPYLIVGLDETLYQGDPYLELLTNFPAASNPILAQWLLFTVTAPDGSTQTYERELFDYVGYDARQGSGAISANIERTSEPVLRETTQVTTLFSPSGVSLDALNHTYPAMVQAVFDGQAALEATDAIVAAGEWSAADWAVLSDARVTFGRVARLAQRMSLLKFAAVSDYTAAAYGEAFQVKAYADAPRIISIAWEEDVETGTGTLSMDLRRNELSVVPYPGQTLDGLRTFNIARGLFEMSLETQILDEIGIEPVTSVPAILAAAEAQAIPLGMYTVTQLDQIDALPISAIAKARITADLTANPRHVVAVPTESVLIGGEPAIGWLQIDMATGEIIDVQENGQHMVAVEYATLLNASIQEIGFAMAGFAHGFAAYTFAWLGGFFGQLPVDSNGLAAAKAAAAAQASALTESLQETISEMCCGTPEWTDAYLDGVTLVNITLKFGDIYDYELVDIKVGGFGNGVAAAEAIIGASDPPLPKLRFSRYAPHFGDEVARAVRTATATLPTGAISANLSTASLSLLGGLDADWTAQGRHALDFASLTAANGTVSEPGGPVLGSGAVSASAVMSSTTALSDSPLPMTFAVAGDGGLADYAAAAVGLAGGAQWQSYVAQISSGQPYSLRLNGAAVTVGGNTYTGVLDVAVTGQSSLAGAGRGAAPTFAGSAQVSLAAGGVMVNPASGSLTVGGAAASAANGFALANFTGTAAVSDAGAADTVTLNGSGAYFALSLSPASSTIAPTGSASFASAIAANASGTYTMTVFAPPGWTTAIAGSGQVTATPPPGAAPGVYQVLVTAQSAAHPDLFASAIHEVTTTALQAVEVSVAPDPRWSVPWGIALRDDGLSATNTGQVQLPGAAFTIDVDNPSTVAHSFDVTVTGLPAGWSILDGEEGADTTTIQAPAGGSGQIGLYVRPTGSLTPIGATYPFVVSVTDNDGAGLSDTANGIFTMPSIPFNYLTAEPGALYAAANSSVAFDVVLQNVGNAAASFPLSAQMPAGDWSLSGLASPVNLNAGQTNRQGVTLNAGAGALGQTFEVLLESPATGTIYTQRLRVPVRIVGAGVGAGFGGAAAAEVCDAQGATAAAMRTLAIALANLEISCATGTCDLPLRNTAVDAANSVADYADLHYPLADSAGALTTLAAALAGHTTPAQIGDDIIDLGDALAALGGQVCEISQHLPSVRWQPNFNAGLPGQPVGYTLALSNRGTVDTSYAVTVTLPGGVSTLNPTVAAGATYTETVAASSPTLGQFALLAEAEATGAGVTMSGIVASSTGWLNVVDRFVQITAVVVDPPFVETGVSSTTLSIDVANVANVRRAVSARAAILDAGGSQVFADTLPLTLLAGAPRSYELLDVDTSGWASGIYTVEVELLDAASAQVPDGYGYGFLGAGQALQLSQALDPPVVAPGAVTVTTAISSALDGQLFLQQLAEAAAPTPGSRPATIYDAPVTAADAAYLNRTAQPEQAPAQGEGTPPALLGRGPQPAARSEDEPADDRGPVEVAVLPLTPAYSDTDAPADSLTTEHSPSTITNFPPAYTRVEQNDPAWSYSGTWTTVTLAQASGASHGRNNVAGSTASLAFDGTWISLGFIAGRFSGYAEVFIDGVSQGVIDLYRNEETPVSFLYDGLPGGPHTLIVQVLGSGNPFAGNTRVQPDYADYGDGSALPDGSFEQDDARLLRSNGWSTTTYAGASGGSYIAGSTATAWFPFNGDSFSLHTIAYSNADKARLFVDGVYLDTIDMFAPVFASAGIPRVFSYDGLGAGPHVLQIMTYQDTTSIDKLVTPGAGPFIDPNPPVSGVTRFEADHPSILYNGVPFTQTAQSWVRVANINANRASAGEYIYSAAANDTISFAFEGPWLGVGFATETTGGRAEIAIDGQPVQTVDLYSRADDTASFYFDTLGAGPHTATITVLGSSSPNATGARVFLDYFDVWDGLPLPAGTFEEDSDRLLYSNGWGRSLTAAASGGAYGLSGTSLNSTAWFPFTGDSVTYQGWTRNTYQDVELRIDGVSLGQFDLYSLSEGTRAYSFDGLGAGPHVLEIRRYRGDTATVDALITPAIGPAYQPPAPAAIVRYEEDHPDLRYNGYPFHTRPQSWGDGSTFQNSGTYNASSSTAGNTWSLAFTGRWLNIGFRSSASSGAAQIIIDGVSQGVFDTANGVNSVKNVTFNLAPGAHTVQVVVASGAVMPDYMDVWNGQGVADGWYDARLENETSGLFHFSEKQWWQRAANIYAFDGDYLNSFVGANINLWFTFTGADLTVLGHNRAGTELTVVIDGVNRGVFTMTATPPFSNQPYALHFPGLGEGPHVVQVFVPANSARIDAFEVDPDSFTSYTPVVEWYDQSAGQSLPGTANTGFASTIAVGDLDGDGVVELVAPGLNGRLYVYRGDGQDAGGGTPVVWTSDLVGPAAEPALADLNNDGLAEIIVSGRDGTFAFEHDGALLWSNPAVVSYYAVEDFGWGGPTVGNLDLDPEPEIAIAASQDALYVLDHLGNIVFSAPTGKWATVPVLADITGDGVLDIVVAQEWTLQVYDFLGGGQVVWSRTLPDPINILGGGGAFGPPAVADLDDDGQPEIIMNWGHIVEALRSDGAVLWRYLTNSTTMYRPSPITVADVTGDGQMDIVTASAISSGFLVLNHLLMVLDRQGNLVWSQLVADNTASASGVAAQDLTGDGIWEILWNGATDGFLVLRGSDGKRLFNEPYTGSGTVLDYPTLGDVDGDGEAEVVVSGRNGLFVIGHEGRWADSRPLWNQHNYHITNINDDWSAPANEPNSWELHNTYRTQTPDRAPAPAYQMVFTYTEGSPNVAVLTDTASIPLTAAPPLYTWDYRQEWYQPLLTTTFDSLLTAVQPGEARQVSAGTEVAYRLPSGLNRLTLPPLYAAAPHIIALDPAERAAGSGTTVSYPVILTNPGAAASVYSLDVAGLRAGWWSLPASVLVPAQSSVTPQLVVTIPAGQEAGAWDFTVVVETSQGGEDQAGGRLEGMGPLLEIAVTPADQAGLTGTALTYTLTITNFEATARSYDLSSSGLAEADAPASLNVPGNSSASIEFTARPAMPGPNPFSITAEAAATGAAATDDAAATGVGFTSVGVSIEPGTAPAGPGSSAVLTATISNLGTLPDTYDLAVNAPAGWTASLSANGVPVSQAALAAGAFNSASFQLTVTPPVGTSPGAYPVTVSAVSQTAQPGGPAEAQDNTTIQVGVRGVQVDILSGPSSLLPSQAGVWQVNVANRGSVADSYSLSALGAFSGAAQFTPSTVNLSPGASQVVQLNAGPLPFALPGANLLGVTARSAADSAIIGEDTTTVSFGGQEAVEVVWLPVSQTISQTLEATFMLLITNTGNIETTYAFDVTAPNLQVVSQSLEQLSIPPHMTAANLVTLRTSQAGVFPFSGEAGSTSGPASDTAGAELVVVCPGNPDVNNDGGVTVLDISAVAERWYNPATYTFLHDLNCDGVISIVDIQLATAAFGSP